MTQAGSTHPKYIVANNFSLTQSAIFLTLSYVGIKHISVVYNPSIGIVTVT